MKRTLGTALRFTLGAAALVWLLSRLDADAAWNSLRAARWEWIGVAFLAQLGSKSFWLFRWKELLDSGGPSPGYAALIRLLLLGLFFGHFLPSSIGGDLARGVGLAAAGVTKARAAASVLADRAVGLFALALTAALGGAAGAFLRPNQGPWIPAAVLGVGVALAVGLTFHPRVLAFLRSNRLVAGESGVARRARRLLEAGALLADRRGTLQRALLYSLGLSACSTAYHWAIGRALGIPIPFAAYCVIVPAVMLFSSLPITLNGLGIREVGFVGLLALQGIARPDATVFALLAFAGTLGFSIAGGILFLAGPKLNWAGTPGESR